MDAEFSNNMNTLVESHYRELCELFGSESDSKCNFNRISSVESLSGFQLPRQTRSSDGIKNPKSLLNAERFKKMRARSSKKAKVHSRYCHLCSRPTWRIPVVECSEIHNSGCCKVVCESCFDNNGWDFQSAIQNKAHYKCSHCTNECPKSSRCVTYMKCNKMRQTKAKENQKQNDSESEITEDSVEPFHFNLDWIFDRKVESFLSLKVPHSINRNLY